MRTFTSLLLCLFFYLSLFGEGTRELAPNGSIVIGGTTTTDLAALHINHSAYNNFASYTNPDPHSRLFIHVKDPVTECIYVGFSFAHNNVTSPTPPPIPFEFRIKDPNGNIVYGPQVMNLGNFNINNWSEAFIGPMQIHGAGGYNGIEIPSTALLSQGWTGKGDYYIEFREADGTDFLIDFWDITVADCSGVTPVEKKGRLWSYNWAIFAVNDFGFPNRPFNGAFYVCAPDPDDDHASFVTKIDFNGSGFRPAAFNIAFNSFGSQNTGNLMIDRRSRPNINSTESEYSIFLNDPVEICSTAEVGAIDLIGVGRCDAQGYCIKFEASKAGQVDLLLDFDGDDNIYTPGTADVMVARNVTQDEVGKPACIDWDGLDGLGNAVWENGDAQIPVVIAFAQGIYHFPIYDAEFMTDGFSVEAIRPVSEKPKLYYDDSGIPQLSGSGEPSVQLNGCTTPCHRWTNYTGPDNPGFGNLHTINTWWFSQLIVKEEVLIQPAYIECEIGGADSMCRGDSEILFSILDIIPSGGNNPDVISYSWTGTGISGGSTSNQVFVNQGGAYELSVNWINGVGDTCATTCLHFIEEMHPDTGFIDTLILQGETVFINGESYSEAGQYSQIILSSGECDSVLLITVEILNTVILYDLDACLSKAGHITSMDYSEFVPQYPQPITCAQVTGSIIYRDNPMVNKHSCTPGVFNSPAMCISSLDDCEYDAGNEISLVVEITVTPEEDTAVALSLLTFYERSPLMYDWINGPTGGNNYPTLFGLRVLKNGVEIFRDPAIPTEADWHEISYDFSGNLDFITEDPAVYRFEFLPYCLIGNDSVVAAWDIDHVQFFASCVSPSKLDPFVGGKVLSLANEPLEGIRMEMETYTVGQAVANGRTDEEGIYNLGPVAKGSPVTIKGAGRENWTEGVTAIDLLAIQNHLLGRKLFTSPYQFVAADADRNQRLSVIDILELKKLLLGYYEELPRNDSWQIGNAGGSMSIDNPFAFVREVRIESVQENTIDANFIGIKTGDVSSIEGLLQNAAEVRSDNTFSCYFDFDEKTGMTAVIAGSGLEIQGLQLEFDKVVQIVPGLIPLSHEDIATVEGQTRVIWIGEKTIPVQNGEILFYLQGRTTPILTGANFLPEVYTDLGEQIYTVRIDMREDRVVEEKDFAYVYPNPFSAEFNIQLSLEDAENVHILGYSMDGKILINFELNGEKGLNTVTLSGDALTTYKGWIFMKIITQSRQQMVKLISN